MAKISKIYDDAQRGTQIYPQTHEKAVIDNAGTNLESKLGLLQELINQKQMEVGAVPSDLVPTPLSTHWPTSGGVWDGLYSLENVIGDIDKQTFSVTVAWSQGTIDKDTGENANATVSLRNNGYLHYPNMFFVCDTGYFIKLVVAYDSNSLSSFDEAIYYGFSDGEWDLSKTTFFINTDKYIRIVVGRIDGGVIQESEGSKISVSYLDIDSGLGDTIINEVRLLYDATHKKIAGTSLTSCGATINNNNKWYVSSDYYGALIDVEEWRGHKVSIAAKTSIGTSYAFLKSGVQEGQTPDYATGYSARLSISAGEEVSLTVPADAKYLYVYLNSNGTDYSPKMVVIPQTINEYMAEFGNGLSVMTYNIGHFSDGVYPDSRITSTDYEEKLVGFRKLLSTDMPSIYGIQEYSAIFGKNTDNQNVEARSVLFDFCEKYLITDQPMYDATRKSYACTAMFAHDQRLYDMKINDYVCLENETIQDGRPVHPQDYKYLSASLYWNGVKIKFICTHLAFDTAAGRKKLLQAKQMQEIIEVCENDDYVIIVADFNLDDHYDFDASEFQIPELNNTSFKNAGYICAVGDSAITRPSSSQHIDDVLAKGLKLSNVRVINSDLSDHYPIVCEVNL